ncbi:IS110 family transposase [Paenarthrobacter sp. A20]|uniref:IS110 family transposase n=1 Tax=Paenarthrobacter sp. A20 TaxID=2817891 RepID=UPI0020A01227|nr:IS110 family transposase [Paenarthrobacter sp. A20]MCP1413742.1 hypothetical protein [Paenarthrobacter sp. A20]
MTKEYLKVIAGIDTHADTHHVGVITDTGQHLADKEFPAAGAGYQGIIDFITGFGSVLAAGVEGTGSYGAELSRVLTRKGIRVVEVMRPNRQARRLRGKSDPLDAYQAAESLLSGRAGVTPKSPGTEQWNPCGFCGPSVQPQCGPRAAVMAQVKPRQVMFSLARANLSVGRSMMAMRRA